MAFCGFIPGFGYLTSTQWPTEVPRRSSPRKKVPPGSVGLAGEFSGVYPRGVPRRVAADRPDGADHVRPRPGARCPAPARRAGPLRRRRRPGVTPSVTVLETGLLTTVQDAGRPGQAALGVGRSGRVRPGVVPAGEPAGRQRRGRGGARGHLRRPATAGRGRPGGRDHRRPLRGLLATTTPPPPCAPATSSVLGAPISGLRTYVAVRGGFASTRSSGRARRTR